MTDMMDCMSLRTTDPADPNTPVRIPLDEVSRKIIEQLQQDGRRPYAAVAEAVGLSEAAVRQRVQRLLRSGVVQIVAVTNPLHVGLTRQAMIGIRVDGPIGNVVDAITALDEVSYLVVTAGSFDLLVEVVCADDEHLLRVINGHIRTVDGVRSTETFVYLHLSKQTYPGNTMTATLPTETASAPHHL